MEDTAENEEKVMLDYFNLVKIASFTKLNCTPSICQELVSKTFASALRSFYSSKKFKLSIGTSDPKGLMKTDPNIVYLSISNKKKISLLCEESIMIKKENLKQAIVQVFVRFPRINLKLAAEYIEDIAFIVGDALNIAHDMTIESLRVYFHYVNMTGCRELIEKLSGNLQVLTLVFFDSNVDEVDESMSEQLWQAVSSCPKLVELSVMFDNDLILLEEHPVLMHIVDCLKPLKINYFRTNLREVKADRLDGGMEWLCSALVENEKLRHLNLDLYTEGCYLGDLGDGDDALKVLGRLDSLKISNADVRNAPNKWRSSLRKILPALSEHAVLKITGYCDVEMESSAYATSKTLNIIGDRPSRQAGRFSPVASTMALNRIATTGQRSGLRHSAGQPLSGRCESGTNAEEKKFVLFSMRVLAEGPKK
uniref:Uncharacterized protein n=1 Tax=Plectus sambesii TaxID=2011161 RepID=A0A914VVQ5_9BILA